VRPVVVLLLALALSACTVEVASGRSPAQASPTTSAASPTDTVVDAQPVAAPTNSRAGDERTAVQVVNQFWRQWFAEQGLRYVPPRVEGGYVGTRGPRCDGQPSVPGNAYYCPAGNFLAWDENLMDAGDTQIGDAWLYLVIAHEWGHAIQAQLPGREVSQAVELQADCLAGAALQGAADDQEITRALVAVADDFPWTDQSSHGNAQQRTAAFRSGVRGGVDACLAS
jgi:predicted metalloprotease